MLTPDLSPDLRAAVEAATTEGYRAGLSRGVARGRKAALTDLVAKAFPNGYLAEVLTGRPATYAKAFDEKLHPRDDAGHFVNADHIADAAGHPAKEAELRKKTTKPAERKKLDAALDTAAKAKGEPTPGAKAPHEMTKDEYESHETAIPKMHGVWNDELGDDRYSKQLIQTDQVSDKVVKKKLREVNPGGAWPFPPVVVNRGSGPYELEDGHHRIEVAKRLGMRVIPAMLTDAKAFGHAKPVNTFVEIGDNGEPRIIQPNNETLPQIKVTVPETRPSKNKPDHNKAHRDAVTDALAAGLPVPAHVLADYPDLAAKYGAPAPTPAAKAPAKPTARPTVADTLEKIRHHLAHPDTSATGPDAHAAIAAVIADHTHPELKEIRAALGIKASGRKADVIAKMASRAVQGKHDRSDRSKFVNERMTADEAHAALQAHLDAPEVDHDALAALGTRMAEGLTVKELGEVKRRLGVRAGGGKAAAARKLVDRAVAADAARKAAPAPTPVAAPGPVPERRPSRARLDDIAASVAGKPQTARGRRDISAAFLGALSDTVSHEYTKPSGHADVSASYAAAPPDDLARWHAAHEAQKSLDSGVGPDGTPLTPGEYAAAVHAATARIDELGAAFRAKRSPASAPAEPLAPPTAPVTPPAATPPAATPPPASPRSLNLRPTDAEIDALHAETDDLRDQIGAIDAFAAHRGRLPKPADLPADKLPTVAARKGIAKTANGALHEALASYMRPEGHATGQHALDAMPEAVRDQYHAAHAALLALHTGAERDPSGRGEHRPLTPAEYASHLGAATAKIDAFRAALDAERANPTATPSADAVSADGAARVADAVSAPAAADHIAGMMTRMAGGGFPKAEVEAGLAMLDSLDGPQLLHAAKLLEIDAGLTPKTPRAKIAKQIKDMVNRVWKTSDNVNHGEVTRGAAPADAGAYESDDEDDAAPKKSPAGVDASPAGDKIPGVGSQSAAPIPEATKMQDDPHAAERAGLAARVGGKFAHLSPADRAAHQAAILDPAGDHVAAYRRADAANERAKAAAVEAGKASRAAAAEAAEPTPAPAVSPKSSAPVPAPNPDAVVPTDKEIEAARKKAVKAGAEAAAAMDAHIASGTAAVVAGPPASLVALHAAAQKAVAAHSALLAARPAAPAPPAPVPWVKPARVEPTAAVKAANEADRVARVAAADERKAAAAAAHLETARGFGRTPTGPAAAWTTVLPPSSKAAAEAAAARLPTRPGHVFHDGGETHVVTGVDAPRYYSREDADNATDDQGRTVRPGWHVGYRAVPVERTAADHAEVAGRQKAAKIETLSARLATYGPGPDDERDRPKHDAEAHALRSEIASLQGEPAPPPVASPTWFDRSRAALHRAAASVVPPELVPHALAYVREQVAGSPHLLQGASPYREPAFWAEDIRDELARPDGEFSGGRHPELHAHGEALRAAGPGPGPEPEPVEEPEREVVGNSYPHRDPLAAPTDGKGVPPGMSFEGESKKGGAFFRDAAAGKIHLRNAAGNLSPFTTISQWDAGTADQSKRSLHVAAAPNDPTPAKATPGATIAAEPSGPDTPESVAPDGVWKMAKGVHAIVLGETDFKRAALEKAGAVYHPADKKWTIRRSLAKHLPAGLSVASVMADFTQDKPGSGSGSGKEARYDDMHSQTDYGGNGGNPYRSSDPGRSDRQRGRDGSL